MPGPLAGGAFSSPIAKRALAAVAGAFAVRAIAASPTCRALLVFVHFVPFLFVPFAIHSILPISRACTPMPIQLDHERLLDTRFATAGSILG